MSSSRMDAFSDGVIAIIITIMVLELKVPHPVTAAALPELLPLFLSYGLSFIVVGIFWVNHHHLTHQIKQVDGRVLWLNNHLLFWLSLIPFVTAYLGEGYNFILTYTQVVLVTGRAWRGHSGLATHATANSV